MTEQPKPRRFLQIHLSTAVVLMFVAGALIWANSSIQVVIFSAHDDYRNPQTGEIKPLDYLIRNEYCGWPRHIRETSSITGHPEVNPAPRTAFFCQKLFANVLICLSLLVSVLVLCEVGAHLRQRGAHRTTLAVAALIILLAFLLNCQTRLSPHGPPHDQFWGWPFTFAELDSDAPWPSDLVGFLRCPRWASLLANVFVTALVVIAAGRSFELLIRHRERSRQP
jgi:hypothetical protein